MRRTVKDFRNAKGQRLVYLTVYDYPTARLAEAAGVTLGPVLSIADSGAMTDPAPMYRDAVSAAPVPVVGGELGLIANVSVTYEIAR